MIIWNNFNVQDFKLFLFRNKVLHHSNPDGTNAIYDKVSKVFFTNSIFFSVPSYHSRHMVQDAPWNYCPSHSPQKQLQENEAVNSTVRTIDLSIPPPPYILCEVRYILMGITVKNELSKQC